MTWRRILAFSEVEREKGRGSGLWGGDVYEEGVD